MSHYHDSEDLKLLSELRKLAPGEFRSFLELDGVVGTTTAGYRGSIAS